MDIDMKTPEFDMLVYKYIAWIEDYAKHFELSRRLSAASVAQTQQQKAEILNCSEDFSYLITVSDGQISFTRAPLSSEFELENSFIYETFTMIETILPEQIMASLESANQEIAGLIAPQIKQYVYEKLGGVFS